MTSQKRLSLIYQAAFLMEGKAISGEPVAKTELQYFAECVKLLAIQRDAFIAANAQGLAEGLGLPLRLFTDTESEAADG